MAADGVGAVVVDTNVIFSALLRRESRFAETLLRGEHRFHVCESVLVELFKHKEKILRLSRLADEDLVRFYHVLLRHLTPVQRGSDRAGALANGAGALS